MAGSKIILLGGIALAGLAASLWFQHDFRIRLVEQEDLIRQQEQQLASLAEEHQQLLASAAITTNQTAPEDRTAELTRLRSEVQALRKQTNDLAAHMTSQNESRSMLVDSPPQAYPAGYWMKLREMAGAKPTEARDLASAFLSYVDDHQGQSPSNLDQVNSYLAKMNRTISGTNQFEIVYQGTFERITGIPRGTVAVVRDVQAWLGPDGRLQRVYGMANGSDQIVASDDNFQSWEVEHVIAPPKPGQ